MVINMFKLAKYLKDYKKQVIVGPIFKLTEAIMELFVPLVMANIIDVGAKNGDIGYILKMGGLMVVLGLLGLGCALICQYNAAYASQGFGTVLRNKLFSHINSLKIADIDKFGTPTLINRMTNDVNQLQLAVAMLIRLIVRAPFLVIGATVMSFVIDIQLGFVFLISIPFIVLVLYLVMSRSVPLYKKVQQQFDRVSLITRENLSGIRVIRAFSKQATETKRFGDTADELKNASVRVGKLSALLNPITYTIMNIAIIAIIWFGGYRVFDGALTQGEVIALVQYMTQILLALVVVANLVIIFTKASASARRVNEVLDTEKSDIDRITTPVSYDKSSPAISFDNVSFSYGDGENALSNISFTINRGETIGIIGGTGSGKSTITKLITGLYDKTDGEILINGVDIKNYPSDQLHSIISIVLQKALLFSGSIRENIKWGNQSASDEEIWRSLEIAQASDFVNEREEKLDYMLLQGGKNLSGGQRQRLTIARAVVANSEILILDDSLSALDFATDSQLRSSIKASLNGTTVIMVSQRVASIKDADKILVIDDGELASIGTHEELLTCCEVYGEICNSQLSSSQA